MKNATKGAFKAKQSTVAQTNTSSATTSGWVEQDGAWYYFDENGNPTPRADKILRNTPMGRFGESDELVGGVFFLADSTLSSFVNGVVLPIDGGFAAYSGV